MLKTSSERRPAPLRQIAYGRTHASGRNIAPGRNTASMSTVAAGFTHSSVRKLRLAAKSCRFGKCQLLIAQRFRAAGHIWLSDVAPSGREPAILGYVGRYFIQWAVWPTVSRLTISHSSGSIVPLRMRARARVCTHYFNGMAHVQSNSRSTHFALQRCCVCQVP